MTSSQAAAALSLPVPESVEQTAATAAKAGVDTLVLTHYVPAIASGQEDQWRQRAASVFNGRIELGNDPHRVEVDTPV